MTQAIRWTLNVGRWMLNVLPLLCLFACPARAATVPFVITVVDDQTGRGVPLVELS